MTNKIAFKNLGLSANSLDAVNKKGFEEPTAIQALTIPVMLQNDTDIIAQAQTGTGKTAAFALPLIDMIDPACKTVRALVLVPTRELAIQVAEEINSLKNNKNLIVVPIYGGQSIEQQLRRLKKGVHIVVGTPGRVIDHLKRKTLALEKIEHLILDEADEMLNMGFIDDMDEIIRYTNPQKRMLMFSATMPAKIKALAHDYMPGYEFLTVEKNQLTTNLTEQIYYEVKSPEKFEALCRILDIEDEFYGLIFCRTRRNVDSLTSRLCGRGYDAVPIHGDITQAQRERALNKFRKQEVNILVGTDVAARGIDVIDLTHVINYSLPQDPELYVHRIGRTGRAGKQGTAITFITPGEYKNLVHIQRSAKTDIRRSKVPRVRDIIRNRKNKIIEELTAIVDNGISPDYYKLADELLQNHNPVDMMAAILNHSFENTFNPDAYSRIQERETRTKQSDMPGKTRLFVALGKKDQYNAKKLVDLVLSRVSLKPGQISDIQVMDKFSFITVPFEKAEKIIKSFKQKGRRPLIEHAGKKGRKAA